MAIIDLGIGLGIPVVFAGLCTYHSQSHKKHTIHAYILQIGSYKDIASISWRELVVCQRHQ